MKKIVIAAGTGFLGEVLVNYFKDKCEEIVVLTRGKSKIRNTIKYVHWDAKTLTGWETELENATALINLAGKSVDCRYTDTNKKEILASRVDSTAILNIAVLSCKKPPKHWLNSSTATIYRHSEDKQMTELNGEIGNDFSMNVAKTWEQTFFEVPTKNTLKTALRTSIVLGKNGGAFIPLKRLSQFGLGGKQGNGNQFISWVHEYDFASAIDFIIQQEMTGVINIVSPKPIQNKVFMKQLRKVVGMSIGFPISLALLKLGAKIIGTEPELVLKSRNVIPGRLLQNGFQFEFDTLEKTFKNLVS
ncbi:TIGR01777 family protein [Flavobacterium jejuense]|uniref:TIGR01777 family protein n=1 Tax=Flavobacterium jejuense TaxID=1544455 RepID=A0ABX0IVH4_9FLAO|nr:TIGR01777 family oxidoreductase [Flavobacterium jejuense]NHN27877.1 TIGR01777 family protein [Flavobacterium jejuense]